LWFPGRGTTTGPPWRGGGWGSAGEWDRWAIWVNPGPVRSIGGGFSPMLRTCGQDGPPLPEGTIMDAYTNQSNPLADARYTHDDVNHGITVELSDPQLVRIDRIRLLTEPGYPVFDVSYVYGTLTTGERVRVDLGTNRLPRKGTRRELVKLAGEAGRYAKGLGMLDDDVISAMW
jgi:hypothetical protein